MLNQKVKHFRNMNVKISHYIFSSLSKLLQLASDALELWERKYVQVILTLTSYKCVKTSYSVAIMYL